MKRVRLSIVGFGVVGQGLAELLHTKRELLRRTFSLEVVLVSVSNSRHGFIYRDEGLDIPTLLDLSARRQPLTQHADIQHWPNALEGLQATTADVLAEATWTNLQDAEPGISHIRAALTKGIHVISANKGPAALAATELLTLAQQHGVQLRLEATVMAGTPILSTVQEGMAGVNIHAVRGILNGTTNYILTAMARGRNYAEVLAEAQGLGYAEADPTADVEGYDVVAKTLILAALVFGQSLKPEQVKREGITGITREQIQQAAHEGKRIKLVASLSRAADMPAAPLEARVEPIALAAEDALAQVNGVMNALTFHSDSLSSVTIIGPGAGRLETGQGLLADLIAVSKTL
ncbi:homoserine dehydrogenase [Dictyobacter alpinus]|uniref:Homoserine dehydrogenase n=1 Tax=Dictyobacter alpinus TaxID=2014873 RepID=A0A402B075_9CHLR|nr:homoserine dehydrogenase [Dictyobacter alpinus]GCE24755.1 homoserine dehydrogenase [Dictyobacter alpinus]